jgi:hypothetical protein
MGAGAAGTESLLVQAGCLRYGAVRTRRKQVLGSACSEADALDSRPSERVRCDGCRVLPPAP